MLEKVYHEIGQFKQKSFISCASKELPKLPELEPDIFICYSTLQVKWAVGKYSYSYVADWCGNFISLNWKEKKKKQTLRRKMKAGLRSLGPVTVKSAYWIHATSNRFKQDDPQQHIYWSEHRMLLISWLLYMTLMMLVLCKVCYCPLLTCFWNYTGKDYIFSPYLLLAIYFILFTITASFCSGLW